eukprot:CAMPEP_0183373132 /NCGR_PEP_ID=MMETSP0164_2-20130417/110538_1 /TAXON_ID=221442 /ORGANISM="Coccolithus pelagicus ssp braarudi, Strain PLY182g" /LENGTH=101 /DNA_ID=CAMNT_0025549961 /DNA_START=258 /DNA_END=559 /DNA_ORIENTATION=+
MQTRRCDVDARGWHADAEMQCRSTWMQMRMRPERHRGAPAAREEALGKKEGWRRSEKVGEAESRGEKVGEAKSLGEKVREEQRRAAKVGEVESRPWVQPQP